MKGHWYLVLVDQAVETLLWFLVTEALLTQDPIFLNDPSYLWHGWSEGKLQKELPFRQGHAQYTKAWEAFVTWCDNGG